MIGVKFLKMNNDIIKELYDAYKGKVEEASSMWKSEYCYSQEEENQRDMEDKEDLLYFEGLLQEIKKLYNLGQQ